MNIDTTLVRVSAKTGKPLVIKTHTLPDATLTSLEIVLQVFLEETGQLGLKDHLAYCLSELTGNAKKANSKRVYFLERGLTINDADEYRQGMLTFKDDTFSSPERYAELQVKNDLHLKVTFLIRNNVLYLSVRNNCAINSFELERIRQQVTKSWQVETIQEIFDSSLDGSEGSGLGLATLVLILKKMGLNENSLEIGSDNQETSVTLRIPVRTVKFEMVDQITEEISSVVQSIPPFPENLQRLYRLLEDPEIEFSRLAAELGRDPAMTADLIKYINSAANRNYKRIENLEEAIRIVGTQGLKDLIYPYGAHKILGTYLEKQRQLWDNATVVSQYAVDLALELRFDWHEKGRTQIAGLLYNLGQIVLTFLHPNQSLKILEFCRKKKLSIELFDKLTQSVNPPSLGALIAEKWRFPDDLIQLLRYQNAPEDSPEPLRIATAAIYLASSLRSVELGILRYEQISSKALTLLNISTELLEGLHRRFLEAKRNSVNS